MATTAAERQAAYRRRQAGGTGDKRLNTWISADASRALEHLARVKSMTQRSVLENLILAAAAEMPAAKPAEAPQATASEQIAEAADDKPNSALSSDMERLEELSRANRGLIPQLAQSMVAILNAKDADSSEAARKDSKRLVRESEQVRRELRKLSRRITQEVTAQKRTKEDSHE